MSIGVVVADDQAIVRAGFRMLIDAEPDLAVLGEAADGAEAVAVSRAVAWGSRVVLMDEPTAALGVEQQARVGELIQTVAGQGLPVLLISHNLQQVHAICDRIVVLFHGTTVADLRPKDTEIDDIVSWITGAAIASNRKAS
jgi:ABC-type sugar transport system ATPase subunit